MPTKRTIKNFIKIILPEFIFKFYRSILRRQQIKLQEQILQYFLQLDKESTTPPPRRKLLK